MDYIIEDRLVKLEVFLFNLSNSSLHLVFNLSDLLVSLIDSNSLNLVWKWQFFNALLDLLESNLALFLNKEGLTKKSNISTIKIYYYYIIIS